MIPIASALTDHRDGLCRLCTEQPWCPGQHSPGILSPVSLWGATTSFWATEPIFSGKKEISSSHSIKIYVLIN